MAVITLVSFGRSLSAQENQTLFDYIKGQMATGATTGISWGCQKAGLESTAHSDLRERDWQTEEQANAFIAFVNSSFNPAPSWAEVVVPGQPFVIQAPTGPIPTPDGP